MKKIMNIAAIATILLVFAACEKSSTSLENNSSQDEMAFKKKAVTRPFKAHDTGTISIVYEADNECYPNFSQIQFTGSGTGTHIGNHTGEWYVCMNQQGGLEGAFNGTMTAANGDQIFFSQPDPSVFTIDENGNVTGNFDIVGGTGKFENATGHFNTTGVDDFVNMTFDIYSDGYITY
jgi:Cu/Zn superoxide dismutase